MTQGEIGQPGLYVPVRPIDDDDIDELVQLPVDTPEPVAPVAQLVTVDESGLLELSLWWLLMLLIPLFLPLPVFRQWRKRRQEG